MINKKWISLSLTTMLLLSMAMMTAGAYTPPSTPPNLWFYIDPDPYEVTDTANLTCTHDFNVTVNLYNGNATSVQSVEFKLGFNTTLLNATAVYKGVDPLGASIWGPVDPITLEWTPLQNVSAGFVWVVCVYALGQAQTTDIIPIVTITFHVMKAPERDVSPPNPPTLTLEDDLDLYDTEVVNNLGTKIGHDADDGYYKYIRPQIIAGAPIVDFTWLPLFPKVCDDVTVDGSGTDPNGASDFITLWQWTIANTTGSAHWITADNASTRTFHCDGEGDVTVTLYVEDNEGMNGTKPHVISQTLALGPEIDLFTQTYRQYPEGTVTPYDGTGPHQPADSFAPGENVSLWAYVTYNGEHVQNILVGFEVLDPNGNCTTYRVDPTNETGYAQVWFRIPIPCDPAEQEDLFGHYWVIAKCKLQDDIINDTMGFKVGFIVEIPQLGGLVTLQDPLIKKDTACFNVTLKNIGWVPRNVTVIVVVYDECDVPVGQEILEFNMPAAPNVLCSNISVTRELCIPIPKWAYVGVGKVYANAFTHLPQDCGIPYCPEASILVPIDPAP